MKEVRTRLPETDSIEELARFWDTHDLTDFEDELEEVTEPIFIRKEAENPISEVKVWFQFPELELLKTFANARGIGMDMLVREWVLERLQTA